MEPRALRLWLAVVSLAAGVAITSHAQLGVMGDSLSDEYFEETYGSYATNWVPQLVVNRGIDVGPTAVGAGQPGGTWGTPRRTGYQYDWALSGDTSADLIAHGQHTGLAAQVLSGAVTHAVLAIGANDFHPAASAYFNIYNNFWLASAIDTYVAGVLTNIETTLATVTPTGVQLVLFNLLDYGGTPAVYNNILYTNDTKRDRVTAAIAKVNTGLVHLAQKYQVPLVDAFRLQKTLFGPNTNLLQYAYIGNVPIKLKEGDTDPINNPNRMAAFVEDEAHPHTTIQSLFANGALAAFQLGYEATIPLFTEQEIIENAGLPYGGADTLADEIGDIRDYVVLPVLPQVTGMTIAGGAAQVWVTTVSNQLYQVEMTDSLSPPAWTPLTNHVPGTGGTVLITDPDAGSVPQRYYRVRQLP